GRDAEHSTVRQFFPRVVEELGQAKWRISKVERSIRLVYQVVGAIQPLTVIAIGHDSELTILFQTHNSPITVLVDSEAAFGVESKTVGTGLSVLADVDAAVAALGHEHRKLSVRRP